MVAKRDTSCCGEECSGSRDLRWMASPSRPPREYGVLSASASRAHTFAGRVSECCSEENKFYWVPVFGKNTHCGNHHCMLFKWSDSVHLGGGAFASVTHYHPKAVQTVEQYICIAFTLCQCRPAHYTHTLHAVMQFFALSSAGRTKNAGLEERERKNVLSVPSSKDHVSKKISSLAALHITIFD